MLSLKLIEDDITEDEIKLLVKWRKKVQPLWRETFEITHEGTKKWIKGIINNPKKMLFFIVKDGELIGHVGFDTIGKDSNYIGNVIRGEGESDGSMTKAINILIKMSYQKDILLEVSSYLDKAIYFYKKIGFKENHSTIKYLVMKYEK